LEILMVRKSVAALSVVLLTGTTLAPTASWTMKPGDKEDSSQLVRKTLPSAQLSLGEPEEPSSTGIGASPTLEGMPLEVFSRIVGFISAPQDMASLHRTSRTIHNNLKGARRGKEAEANLSVTANSQEVLHWILASKSFDPQFISHLGVWHPPKTEELVSLGRLSGLKSVSMQVWSQELFRGVLQSQSFNLALISHLKFVCTPTEESLNDLGRLPGLKSVSMDVGTREELRMLASKSFDPALSFHLTLKREPTEENLDELGRLSGLKSVSMSMHTQEQLRMVLGFPCAQLISSLELWDVPTEKELAHLVTLPNLQSVDLSNTNVTDVSAWRGLHTLNLRGCLDVTDASALGNVYNLNLSLTNVTDVSPLGNVPHLNLAYTKVTDVSPLRGARTLNLAFCRNVTAESLLSLIDAPRLRKLTVTQGGRHSFALEQEYAAVLEQFRQRRPDIEIYVLDRSTN
jgi:hypothetical protein